MENVEIDIRALREAEGELEAFKKCLSGHCDDMKDAVSISRSVLKDEKSRQACEKVENACTAIQETLGYVQRVLERVRDMIAKAEKAEQAEM